MNMVAHLNPSTAEAEVDESKFKPRGHNCLLWAGGQLSPPHPIISTAPFLAQDNHQSTSSNLQATFLD